MTTAREEVAGILRIPPQTGGDIEEAILLLADRIDGLEAEVVRLKEDAVEEAMDEDQIEAKAHSHFPSDTAGATPSESGATPTSLMRPGFEGEYR